MFQWCRAKRSLILDGSGYQLKKNFWIVLAEIAATESKPLAKLVGEIAEKQLTSNLVSSIRIVPLQH